jgi:hypothetical protein
MGTKNRPIHFRKKCSKIKVVGVNTHTIENGMDFVRIGNDWQLV